MTTLKTTTQITDINIPVRYSAQQRTAASFLDTVNSHCVSLSESVEYHLEMYGNWIPASRTGRLNCKNSARQQNIRTLYGLLLTSSLPLSPTTTNRDPCFVYTPFSIKTRMLLSTFFSIMLTRSSHVFDLAAVQSNDVWGRTNKLTPHPTPQFIRLDTNPTPLRYVDQSGSKNLPEQDEGRWGEGSIYFSQIIDAMFWTTKLVLSCFGTIHEIQREAHTQKNALSPCLCCQRSVEEDSGVLLSSPIFRVYLIY